VERYASGKFHYASGNNYYYEHPPEYLLAGIFGILGFGLGLTGGILTLKRRMFGLAILGTVFIMVGGIFSFADILTGIVLGIPALVLAIISLVFTGVSHREFT